jgi:hypothetical protein
VVDVNEVQPVVEDGDEGAVVGGDDPRGHGREAHRRQLVAAVRQVVDPVQRAGRTSAAER